MDADSADFSQDSRPKTQDYPCPLALSRPRGTMTADREKHPKENLPSSHGPASLKNARSDAERFSMATQQKKKKPTVAVDFSTEGDSAFIRSILPTVKMIEDDVKRLGTPGDKKDFSVPDVILPKVRSRGPRMAFEITTPVLFVTIFVFGELGKWALRVTYDEFFRDRLKKWLQAFRKGTSQFIVKPTQRLSNRSPYRIQKGDAKVVQFRVSAWFAESNTMVVADIRSSKPEDFEKAEEAFGRVFTHAAEWVRTHKPARPVLFYRIVDGTFATEPENMDVVPA
jgi:hypothetical protein